MSLVAAYWHKEGLEIYRYVHQKPVREASGPLPQMKPNPRLFGKRVLVIGSDLLFHIRKRYPPAAKEKLVKALALEIGDLFPLSKPAFHCEEYESSPTHTTLDIWAWESSLYSQVREVFSFDYVIPEDLCYFADIPEIKVFQHRGITRILAHSGHKYLDGTSYPEGNPGERPVERFLQGLGRHRDEIKRIKIYGTGPVPIPSPENLEISEEAARDYPPGLDFLAGLDLKKFKEKKEFRILFRADLFCRIVIYLILGYGLVLYLTAQKYDRASEDLRRKIKGIDAKVSLQDPRGKGEDYSGVVQEINERLRSRPSPLKIMDAIARKLPAGSSVNRMVLNEINLELSVSSREPLSVVRAIGAGQGFKTVRLKGTPVKDSATGGYNFILMIELSRS